MRKSISIRLLGTHPARAMYLSFCIIAIMAYVPSVKFCNLRFTLNDSSSMMPIICTASILSIWFHLPPTPWDKAQPAKVSQRKYRQLQAEYDGNRSGEEVQANHLMLLFSIIIQQMINAFPLQTIPSYPISPTYNN